MVSDGLGKADALVSVIEDGVVGADDGVSENPLDFELRGEIHADEAGEALGRSSGGVVDGDNVLIGLEDEGGAADGDGDVREEGDLVAVDDGLAHGGRQVVAELVQILENLGLGGVALQEVLDPSDDILAGGATRSAGAGSNGAADLIGGHTGGEVVEDDGTETIDDLLAREGDDTSGTNLLVDGSDDADGSGDKGGSSIGNDLAVGAELVASNGKRGQVEGPVGLVGQGSPGDLSSVLGGVDSSEDELTDLLGAHVEGEERSLDDSLSHHVLEQGGNLINRDGLEGHTDQTVELGGNESHTGLSSDLGEDLLRNGRSSDSDGILGQETSSSSRSVLDREGTAILDVGGGLGVVVLRVEIAANLVNRAERARHLESVG